MFQFREKHELEIAGLPSIRDKETLDRNVVDIDTSVDDVNDTCR